MKSRYATTLKLRYDEKHHNDVKASEGLPSVIALLGMYFISELGLITYLRICCFVIGQIYGCKKFLDFCLRGSAKKKIQRIRDYYGSGWLGPGLTQIFFFLNRPK